MPRWNSRTGLARNDDPVTKLVHRTGRLRSFTSLIGVVLILAACGGSDIEDAVSEQRDGPVTCEEAGWMLFVGERETVYACREGDEGDFGEPVGCYVST